MTITVTPKTINLSYTANCAQCGLEFTKDYGKAPGRWPRYCSDACGAKARWYANRDHRLAQKRVYRAAHREELAAKNRAWRVANRAPAQPRPSIREELEAILASHGPSAVDAILATFKVSRRRGVSA